MTEYVCGFLFNPPLSHVALIKKAKPDWQAGLLNGVGGKIEENETALYAMAREFTEETGVPMEEHEGLWTKFLIYEVRDPIDDQKTAVVSFYTARLKQELSIKEFVSEPNEPVQWYPVNPIFRRNSLPNLDWLIPMAQLIHSRPDWHEKMTMHFRS